MNIKQRMKKIKLAIVSLIVAIFILFSGGCTRTQIQYTVDIAKINADYNLLEHRYTDLKELTIQKMGVIVIEDQATLIHIDSNVMRIKTKVDEFRSDQFYKVTPADMGYLYTLAKESVEMSRALYIKYEPQLTSSEAIKFKMFDENLKELDSLMIKVMEDPDNADINYTLMSILSVTSMGLKVLLPLVL